MNDLPLVSLIIVNFNGKSNLEKCLNSLKNVNYENFEIILVDNNSTDNSVEFVQKNFTSTKIIKLDKNYGFAKSNNLGAKNAKGKFLLFLNNDTIVSTNFITEMIQVMKQNPAIAICQSLLLKPNGSVDSSGDFIDTLGRAFSSKKKLAEITNILSARGAAMLVNKEIFCELDGFDEKFFASFEDVDLGWRAWILGYQVVLVPNSVVYHTGGQTIKNLKDEIKFHGVKNSLILRLTNFEFFYAFKSIIILFFVTFSRKFFGVSIIKDPETSPPLPSYKLISKGVLWIFKNRKYVFSKYRKVNSKRILSTKKLIEMGLIKTDF